MSRPLTRKEWDDFCTAQALGHDKPLGLWRRIEATVEAGGFAPERIAERTLFDWLYGTDMHDRTYFRGADLYAAWARARAMRRPPIVTLTATGIRVTGGNKSRVVGNAAAAARVLVALAYAEALDTDVSHLLGDAS